MRVVRCNPGVQLTFVAELALEGQVLGCETVIDCENGKLVTLADLLHFFREDMSEAELGFVRITIEPVERPFPRRSG